MKAFLAAVLFAFLVGHGNSPAQNLIPDPTFSSGVSTWTIRSSPLVTALTWNGSPGADGAPGFARLTETSGLGNFIARICLPVEPGTAYSWGGFLRATATTPSVFFDLVFFENSSCEGLGGILSAQTIDVSGSARGVWHLTPGPDVVAPPTAASVAFEVILGVPSPTDESVDFDNVYFGLQGLGPPSVPVSVPTVSGMALILFAASLAGAAIWRLTVPGR